MIILGKNTDDKGKQLEAITHDLLASKGYTNITTNLISTGGHEIDVVADYIQPVLGGKDSRRTICECKAHKKPMAMDDWLKFVGKIYCEQAELNKEITGFFIALSGVNRNVSGNYDKLKLRLPNIILIAGDTLLEELKSLYVLIDSKDLYNKLLSLTNNNVEKIEIAYYKKKLYNVIIFERKGLFTILDNQGNLLDDKERKEISAMVRKELKLKEFLSLEDEVKAKSRNNLTTKTILGAIISNEGKTKKSSLKLLHTLSELKVSSVEIDKAIENLTNENLIKVSADKTEIFIDKKSKDFYSKLSIIYRLLLAGEMTIEAFESLKSPYYLNSINEKLIVEVQKIQGGISLEKPDINRAIKLFKWFPSALAWMLHPHEIFININKGKEKFDKSKFDVDSIVRNKFFEEIISIGLRDLSAYEFPRIYLKVTHNIDTVSSSKKIIFKNDSKIEETIQNTETLKIGELGDDLYGPNGSKYIMMLGPYLED